MRQYRVGDFFIIACKIELGYSLLGVKNTVGMGQLDSGNLNFHIGTLTRGDDFRSGRFFFALNFARRFVFPQPLEGGMA